MFTTSVKLAGKYEYLMPKFKKAFEFLKRDDLKQLEVGNYNIDGDDIYASVQHYTTFAPDEVKFETHKKYFDIQFVAEGCERFGYIPCDELSDAPYNEQKDVTFYDEPSSEKATYLLLREGDFVIVSPEDAHKPRCNAEKPNKVKKIVIKVKI